MICRGYKDITGESAALLAAEPPLALRMIERSVGWLLRTGRAVLHWGHLTEVESTGDGLLHDGEVITMREAPINCGKQIHW